MLYQPYYQGPTVIPIAQPRERTVGDVIPSAVPGFLGFVQLFLWIAIISLEIASIYYDAGRGTIYAGIWCSTIFFVTWVSMFCYLCCGKTSGCGTYLVVQNTINLVFAIILLIFTSRFVNNPCLCYGVLCYLPNWDYIYTDDYNNYYEYLCTTRTYQKLPVLKGLLACAVLMLVCNIVYITMYLIVLFRLRANPEHNTRQSAAFYQHQSTAVQLGGQSSYNPAAIAYVPHQPQQSYPVQHGQPTPPPQYESAPPPYTMHAEKF